MSKALPSWWATLIAWVLLFCTAWPGSARAAERLPILMVIANQDFHYREYAMLRRSLERQGLAVTVAAATTERAIPQDSGPQRVVRPDLALTAASGADYSAIVFVGGWGASSYQYAFEGVYTNPAYRADPEVVAGVNRLIGEFVAQDKYVAAICHGVSVLAYARVDGTSPLRGRTVVGWAGGGPGFRLDSQEFPDSAVADRWHVEAQGSTMLLSAAVGDPLSSTDDVWIDGNIITAENYDSASNLGRVLAAAIAGTRRPSR